MYVRPGTAWDNGCRARSGDAVRIWHIQYAVAPLYRNDSKLYFASSVLRDVADLGVSVCPDAGGRSSDDQAAQPESVPTAELSRFAGSGMT